MTPDERRIATAALHAGSGDNHDQIVIAIAARLELQTQNVEAVLKRLRIRQVLTCVGTARDVNVNPEQQKASVRYEEGIDWTDED